MTQRIEHFCSKMTQRIELFLIWLKELNPFFNTTRRIEPFFLQYDAENWSFLFLNMTQRIEPFFLNMTQRIEPFFSWIWLKELNFFYDCKLFEEKMSQRIEPFSVTQRIEFFSMPFLIRHTELNHDFTEYNRQNWTFFSHDSNFF